MGKINGSIFINQPTKSINGTDLDSLTAQQKRKDDEKQQQQQARKTRKKNPVVCKKEKFASCTYRCCMYVLYEVIDVVDLMISHSPITYFKVFKVVFSGCGLVTRLR